MHLWFNTFCKHNEGIWKKQMVHTYNNMSTSKEKKAMKGWFDSWNVKHPPTQGYRNRHNLIDCVCQSLAHFHNFRSVQIIDLSLFHKNYTWCINNIIPVFYSLAPTLFPVLNLNHDYSLIDTFGNFARETIPRKNMGSKH